MLSSPYTSNQSVIVPFALVPSIPAVILQYAVIFIASALKIYRDYDPWWTLFLIVNALSWYRSTRSVRADNPVSTPPIREFRRPLGPLYQTQD